MSRTVPACRGSTPTAETGTPTSLMFHWFNDTSLNSFEQFISEYYPREPTREYVPTVTFGAASGNGVSYGNLELGQQAFIALKTRSCATGRSNSHRDTKTRTNHCWSTVHTGMQTSTAALQELNREITWTWAGGSNENGLVILALRSLGKLCLGNLGDWRAIHNTMHQARYELVHPPNLAQVDLHWFYLTPLSEEIAITTPTALLVDLSSSAELLRAPDGRIVPLGTFIRAQNHESWNGGAEHTAGDFNVAGSTSNFSEKIR
ncbi:hypothetical protein B0H14DRAFT_2616554 [Mycena olivaceomarginata]|nr:hypothetical protein B0H14DRAFT_2616554 [Mycena olivaceomarginata]